jgi:hypothetical protein
MRDVLEQSGDALEQALEAMPGPVRYELSAAEYRALRAAKAAGLDYARIESTGDGNRVDAISSRELEWFHPIDDLLEGVEPEPELTDIEIDAVGFQTVNWQPGIAIRQFARAVIAADRAKRS